MILETILLFCDTFIDERGILCAQLGVATHTLSSFSWADSHHVKNRRKEKDERNSKMQKQHRFRSALMVVAAISLAFTGCSGNAASSAGTDDAGDMGSADGAATLRVGSIFPASSLDPSQGRSNSDIAYLNPLYDRLLELGPDLEIDPMLAESFEWNEDRTSLTLKLREDVSFHDGTPFNAEVVKQNIEHKKANGSPVVLQAVESIESVNVIDSATVELELAPGKGANILLTLAEFGGYMVSPEGLEEGNLDSIPAGSGPYELKTFQEGQQVSYVKVDSHWDEEHESRPAEIQADIFTDATTLANAFQDKQLDSIVAEDNARTEGLANTPGVHAFKAEHFAHYKIQLNHGSEKLESKEVRQAIAYALDLEGVNVGVFDGTCKPTTQIAAESSAAHDPTLEDAYTHNVTKAKELLAEAGYPDGIELEGLYASAPPFDTLAEVVQGMLGEAGIELSLRPTTVAALSAEWAEGNADLTFLGGGMIVGDNTGISIEALLRNIDHATVVDGTTEPVEKASVGLLDSSYTPEETAEIIVNTSRAITEDVASIPMCSFSRVVLAHEKVLNYEDVPNVFRGATDFTNMRISQ